MDIELKPAGLHTYESDQGRPIARNHKKQEVPRRTTRTGRWCHYRRIVLTALVPLELIAGRDIYPTYLPGNFFSLPNDVSKAGRCVLLRTYPTHDRDVLNLFPGADRYAFTQNPVELFESVAMTNHNGREKKKGKIEALVCWHCFSWRN